MHVSEFRRVGWHQWFCSILAHHFTPPSNTGPKMGTRIWAHRGQVVIAVLCWYCWEWQGALLTSDGSEEQNPKQPSDSDPDGSSTLRGVRRELQGGSRSLKDYSRWVYLNPFNKDQQVGLAQIASLKIKYTPRTCKFSPSKQMWKAYNKNLALTQLLKMSFKDKPLWDLPKQRERQPRAVSLLPASADEWEAGQGQLFEEN